MSYPNLIRDGVKKSGKTLMDIFLEARDRGIKVSPSYLSKLQRGQAGPASDEINHFLAEILDLDEKELRIEAYKMIIPEDILKELVKRIS